jgi:hypothetical protein
VDWVSAQVDWTNGCGRRKKDLEATSEYLIEGVVLGC